MDGETETALPGRVLVAEDEHLIATGIAEALRSFGVEVVGPVADGGAAVERAGAERVDLAILDIRMPVLDGLGAAKALWEDRGVPSVIVSAYSEEDYLRQAQSTGVFAYLLKPVGAEHLRAALAIAWKRAGERSTREARLAQLENSLTHRRTVERAKWRLVSAEGLTEPEAHARLQKRARDERRPLVEVAREILGPDADAPDAPASP